MPDAAFIAALPKTELHLHLVGSASVDTVLELARRRPQDEVPTDRGELERFYEFRDFAHFVEVYRAVDRLLRGPEDIVTLVAGAARDAAAANARWVELTVTATTHLWAGIGATELAEALEAGRERARADHGVGVGFIFDIDGEFGARAADNTLVFLRDHAPEGSLAIGLAGRELGVDRAQFAEHVAAARALGYRAAIHAGEYTGPESIAAALDALRADRIGHGIRAVEDRALLARLVREQLPLEVCVTSNLRTRSAPSLEEHPCAS